MMKPRLCVYFSPGTWSSPEISGTPPPPSYGHSLTRIDHYRAFQFGGEQLEKLLPNHVYLLDMKSWVRDYVYICMLGDEGKTQNIITCELKYTMLTSVHILCTYLHFNTCWYIFCKTLLLRCLRCYEHVTS